MISQTSIYAFRALGYLARQAPERLISSKEISDSTGVPNRYLSKILRSLTVKGILSAQRGTGGGFRIAVPLGSVNLKQVIEHIEDFTVTSHCLLGQGKCAEESPCALHDRWKDLVDHYQKFLLDTTIENLKH